MSEQVALALIGAFGGVVTALLGFIAKEIAGLRSDLRRIEDRTEKRHEDHEERITAIEKRLA